MNGKVDAIEESIQDCQRDDLYMFYPDGTGLHTDNQLVCGNGLVEMPFNWSFTDNETRLDFLLGVADIVKLTETELVIRSSNFITSFKH